METKCPKCKKPCKVYMSFSRYFGRNLMSMCCKFRVSVAQE